MNAVKKLSAELQKWAWMKPHLEAEEFDPVAMLSALESETNVPECLLELAEAAVEAEALAEQARARAKQIQERAYRLEWRGEKLRAVIASTMRNLQMDKPIVGPTLTVSTREGGRGLIVTDVTKIPKKYFDDADPKLNKRRLRDDLVFGEQVEGATLDNGAPRSAVIKVN